MEVLDSSIYVICHPLTDELIYVGKTHNLKLRAYNHMARKNNPTIHQWVKELELEGLRPKFVEIFSNLSNEQASHLEQVCIFRGYMLGGRLKNKQPMTKSLLDDYINNEGITIGVLLDYFKSNQDKYNKMMGFDINSKAAA